MDDSIRSFGFLLKDVSRLYVQRFEQRARALGFTLPQSKALIHLSKQEGISQSQLSELSDIEPMSLVRILDRMEADGWIARRHDPADRRTRRLYLHAKARPALDQLQRVADLTLDEAFGRVPRVQIGSLIEILRRIQDNLAVLEPIGAGAGAGDDPASVAAATSGAAPLRRRGSTK